MAVGLRSSSTTGTGDSLVSSIGVPVPTGAAIDDICLAALKLWETGDPVVTAPTGFTQFIGMVSGSQKLKIFWKRLTAADTGDYTFSWSGTQWTAGQALLVTGGKKTGDPVVNFNTATVAASANTPTTSVDVSFQPFLANFVTNENTATQTTPPTNFTEEQDGNYLHLNYRIPGSTGLFSASGGVLAASTLQLAALIAVEPESVVSSISKIGKAYFDSLFL